MHDMYICEKDLLVAVEVELTVATQIMTRPTAIGRDQGLEFR